MTDAEIYREAARRVAEGLDAYACVAISNTAPSYYGPQRDNFEWVFEVEKRINVDGDGGWWPEDEKHERVLALCLAAAMAEAGDL